MPEQKKIDLRFKPHPKPIPDTPDIVARPYW